MTVIELIEELQNFNPSKSICFTLCASKEQVPKHGTLFYVPTLVFNIVALQSNIRAENLDDQSDGYKNEFPILIWLAPLSQKKEGR